MGDQELLRYISTIMVGVSYVVGSLSANRVNTIKFIRRFHTRLAWSHLLSRHSRKEIMGNDQLYTCNSLRLPTYKELHAKVDRLCVSIQISTNLWKVRMRSLICFMKAAKRSAKSKLLGLFTMNQESVVDLYLMYCRRAL